MNYFILHLQAGDRAQAAAMLHANEWVVEAGERHRDAIAPGDLALIHVGQPRCEIIGRATLASAWRGGASSGTVADRSSGCVLLADVETWPVAVPLAAAVQRIDPAAVNPYVQSNAAGFRSGVVMVTANEYAAVVALSREAGQT